MTRSVPEWIGKTDDEPVPLRVRLRVFERFGGICCECGVKIMDRNWRCDHRRAIINGGENREKNLGPIHTRCDRERKQPRDVAEKSAAYKRRLKVLGLKQPKGRPLPGTKASGLRKRMDGTVERRR